MKFATKDFKSICKWNWDGRRTERDRKRREKRAEQTWKIDGRVWCSKFGLRSLFGLAVFRIKINVSRLTFKYSPSLFFNYFPRFFPIDL